MTNPPVAELTVEDALPIAGQSVIWLQQRTWGGKQNVTATFLRRAGAGHARIRVDGAGERTVRLKNLRWEGKVTE